MGTKRDARSAKDLLGTSPRLLLSIVACLTCTMLLWPLGGAQAIFGSDVPEAKAATSHEQSLDRKSLLSSHAPQSLERRVVNKVGASIAVHEPKFPFVSRFLEQWYACEPARRSMDMYIIFWGEKDAALFKKGMQKFYPNVAEGSWTAVIADVPAHAAAPSGVRDQIIASWKKWYGITYMMDLDNPPMYGAMLDSELLLYNGSDCGPESEWYRLFERVSALEASKLWPAAKVNDAAKYTFPGGYVQTGRTYDKIILEDNARFIGALEDQSACKGLNSPGCREVKRQIEDVLFSWWTDIPYVNLRVAERMLLSLDKQEVQNIPNEDKLGRWCKHAHYILFPRFEHISYQQWCCLHEGYHFDDVTPVTGPAIWGSYLEDPQSKDGFISRIAELHPLWLPSDANMRIHEGKVPPMSRVSPPLMHLHVDHHPAYYKVAESVEAWKSFCKAEGTECDFYR